MTRPALPILCAALLLAAFLIPSPVPASDPAPARDVRLQLRCDELGSDLPVDIRLPASYYRGGREYPVIYVVEPEIYFDFVCGAVEACSRLGLMPEALVVGVGVSDRWRDLTPTRAGIPDGPDLPQSGGAAAYRRFLVDEVAAHVEANFRTRPYAVLCGHSIAGLFVIDSLLAGAGPFAGFIAVSPSLWWDDETVSRAAADGGFPEAAPPRRLFFAMGGEGPTMMDPAERFGDVLRSAAAAPDWEFRTYPGVEHQVMPLKSFIDGLEFIFAGWRLPDAAMESGLDAVVEHYLMLSRRFGYEIAIPERALNRLGYRALSAGDHDAAIRIFERNAAEHPLSANVHDSLGEALAAAGDTAGAVRSYRRSLELDPANENARRKLEELRR